MNYTKRFWMVAILALAELCLTLPAATGQEEVTALLARLNSERFDESVLYDLERQPSDVRTIPALEAAFDNRAAKSEKQAIAGTLLRLGSKAKRVFEFLATYTREAVDDRTPFFLRVDANGLAVSGQFSAEFENWCAQNGKDPKSVAALQWMVYPKDVLALAEVQDPRASELFRKGLDSPNPVVVSVSVRGLGRLRDVAAIPLIAKACDRLPSARRAVAVELPWYSHPEADVLMERLVPDRKARDHYAAEVHRLRRAELDRILSRTGGANEK
jgi:PBS lyase HEAT-like repeat